MTLWNIPVLILIAIFFNLNEFRHVILSSGYVHCCQCMSREIRLHVQIWNHNNNHDKLRLADVDLSKKPCCGKFVAMQGKLLKEKETFALIMRMSYWVSPWKLCVILVVFSMDGPQNTKITTEISSSAICSIRGKNCDIASRARDDDVSHGIFVADTVCCRHFGGVLSFQCNPGHIISVQITYVPSQFVIVDISIKGAYRCCAAIMVLLTPIVLYIIKTVGCLCGMLLW